MYWPSEPAELIIKDDEVHVWAEVLDQRFQHLESFYNCLDLRERKRAARYRFQLHRHRFIVAHGLLRKLLGCMIDMPAEKIRFRYGKQGKPFLADENKSDDLQFNISHSGGIVLIGLCRRRRVGVDLEVLRYTRDFMGVAERFFSSRETAAIKDLSLADQTLLFYQIWTQKEAYLKGLGCGLTFPLDSFEAPILSEIPAPYISGDQNNIMITDWEIRSLNPISGYIGSVASEGRDWKLKYWPPRCLD
jgi:4'-phosphopantetheinyl transferase